MDLIQAIRNELHDINNRVSLVIRPTVATMALTSNQVNAPQQETQLLSELQMLYNQAKEIKDSIVL